ncbi:flagellar biosynthesis protein FlhF [Robertmurraya sp. GLU-23]
MKVKKYTAPNMPEAMKQIRAELGNDAVILNSKIVTTGGFLGFFTKENIEVIAAIDEVIQAERKMQFEQPKVKVKPIVKPVPTMINREEEHLPSRTVEPSIPKPLPKQLTSEGNKKPEQDMLAEIAGLKKMLQTVTEQQPDLPLPEPIQKCGQLLLDQDVPKDIRDELMSSLLQKWYSNGSGANEREVNKWLRQELYERLSTLSFGGITFTKKYINLVGPTGVGKTTTLAKIAAECALKYNKRVALITTDTYRIAAIDQLKTYAKILNVPLEVCYSLEDYKQACEAFKDYDIVLIDTAGRNFRNQQYVEDLKKVVDFEQDMETFLVLALTAKQKDMIDIYKQFSLIKINKFIFTKADETSTYGAMLHMMKTSHIGVAYITNGQNVPDDMISANREQVTNLILGVE